MDIGQQQEPSVGDAVRPASNVAPVEDTPRRRFDPKLYVRQLRGRGGASNDYLDVKWRLRWLRDEHPAAEIVTDHVQIDPAFAIFKATVTLPTGGKATGYGSESKGDFGDFIEKAETKAIGRALNALGYGHPPTDDPEEDDAPARLTQPAALPRVSPPPPVELNANRAPRQAERDPAPRGESRATRESSAPAYRNETEPASGIGEDRRAPEPSARAARTPRAEAAPVANGDEELTDYSWNSFWRWARGLGINSRQSMEAFIGRSVDGMTPKELHDLVRERRGI